MSVFLQHHSARSPPRAHTMPYPVAQVPPQQHMQQQPLQQQQQQPPPNAGPVVLAPEQLSKLKNELDIVQQNIKVFSEMLTELNPAQEHQSDLDLLEVSDGIVI